MASSYAAAISALITTSTLNPPIKPSRPISRPISRPPSRPPVHPSIRPSCPDSPKPSPPRKNPAALQQPSEPLGSYEEQQENPADYGIGRQHQNLQHLVWRPWRPGAPGANQSSYVTLCCCVLQAATTMWGLGRFLWTATKWCRSWAGVTFPPCGSAGTCCKNPLPPAVLTQ